MSEIKTKIRTYNDVIDLFGEEKAADMLSEALDWSTIDPKNDKKNIMERKPLLLDPYMTYEGEDYCKHIVAGFLGDRDLDWASGYIDEEKIKNGQVMPADLKSALSMALDNELSTSWAYLDALSPSARKSSINLPNISNLPALPAGSSCPESMSWIPMR